MLESYVTGVIAAPVGDVWAILSDFGSVKQYFPSAVACHLEGDARCDQVGALRVITLKNGDVARERLTSFSDSERSFSYDLIDNPAMPLLNYSATTRLKPITTTDQTFIEWESVYEITTGEEADVRRFVEVEVYEACIIALQTLFRR